MIRKIRDLLYDQGFTISGARNKLHEIVQIESDKPTIGEAALEGLHAIPAGDDAGRGELLCIDDFEDGTHSTEDADSIAGDLARQRLQLVRRELFEIRDLLGPSC